MDQKLKTLPKTVEETFHLIPGCKHFTWSEALYLPQWDVYAIPTELQAENIIAVAGVLEKIRSILRCPLRITSWLRPPKYNELIGGAEGSAHPLGMAVDFKAEDFQSDEVRKRLHSHLEAWNFRMENLATPHVHIDIRQPRGGLRYFLP